MDSNKKNCKVQGSYRSGDSKEVATVAEDMGKEERKDQVLKLLADSDLALTPYVMFRNLKMRGSTFERRTLSNYLTELGDEGRIRKIENDGDPLYEITEEGRSSLENSS